MIRNLRYRRHFYISVIACSSLMQNRALFSVNYRDRFRNAEQLLLCDSAVSEIHIHGEDIIPVVPCQRIILRVVSRSLSVRNEVLKISRFPANSNWGRCSLKLHRVECFVHFDSQCISETHWTCLRERPETPRFICSHSYIKEKVPTIGTFLIPFISPLTSKPRTQRASKA